jgi:hypothetical protein
VLQHKLSREIRSVGILISGGNVDFDVLGAICQEAA